MLRRNIHMTVACVLAVILPALGIILAGRSTRPYLEFPPLTRYVEQAGFSWPVFIVMALMILAVILPFDFRVWRKRVAVVGSGADMQRRLFPWWGWAAVLACVAAWILAWTRFSWFERFQPFTFSPLWFAYIVVVNAWKWKRTGECMLTDRPVLFFRLFLLSAIFWWYFEYLNRFVQNWYYVGCDGLTKLEYFIFATLPFSTVLPAVLGTYELLKSFSKAGAGLDDFIKIRVRNPAVRAGAGLLFAGAGLALIGIYPDYLYPLLWVSPLLVIVSVQCLCGHKTIFAPVAQGCWRNVYLLASAALICGFFWEMWNILSYAKWLYAVPFVGEFRLFEMPVLGYAGYLPFGLECAVVAELAGYKGEVTSDKGEVTRGK